MTPTTKRRLAFIGLLACALAAAWWLLRPAEQVESLAALEARLASGDAAGVVLQLKSQLQQTPDAADARLLLGKALLAEGNAAAADAELQRAIQAGISIERAALPLAHALLDLGQASKVISQLSTVKLSNAQDAAALSVHLATAYAAGGDLIQSQAEIEAAFRRMPNFLPALVLSAKLAAGAGDTRRAIALVDAALSQQAQNANAWELKGDLLRAQRAGSAQPALEAYRKALDINPKRLTAHASMVSMHLEAGDLAAARTQWTAMAQAQPSNALTAYFDALLALREGQPLRAREASQKALKTGAVVPALFVVAGQAEFQLGALAQAESLFAKAITADPKGSPPRHHLATVLLRRGQAQRALAVLEPLTAAQSTDALAVGLAARAYLALGEFKLAAAAFDRATRLAPDNISLRVDRARALPRLGQPESASGELEALVAGDTGIAADLALITLHVQRKDFNKAKAAVDRLARKDPSNPLSDDIRGQIALLLGNNAEARTLFERALATNSAYLPALLRLASLDLAERKLAAARAHFSEILKIDPKNSTALMSLAELGRMESSPFEDVTQLVEQAVQGNDTNPGVWIAALDLYQRAGRAEATRTTAQRALAALPDDPSIVERVGIIERANGDVNSATRSFRRLASLLPDRAAAKIHVARLMLSVGAPDEADALVLAALALEPKAPPVLVAAIDMAKRKQQVDRALGWSRELQLLLPKEAAGFLFEGDLELGLGQWDRALVAYGKALTLDRPGKAPIGYFAALHAAKRDADAERFEAAWLRSHPRDVEFRLYLAAHADAAGQAQQAESHLRRALDAVPDNTAVLNNLALLLHKQRKPGALAMVEKAIELSGNVPAFHDTLATILSDTHGPKQALAAQLRAVALAPESGAINLNLAKLYLKTGDKPQAIEVLSALAKRGSSFGGQGEVTALLNQLVPAQGGQVSPGVPGTPPAPDSTWAVVSPLALPVAGAALVALLGILITAGLQNGNFLVKRALVIQAPAAEIFDLLQTLHRWERWSNLRPFKPSVSRTFSRVQAGLGATCTWRDPRKRIEGTVEVVHTQAPNLLAIELNRTKPDERRELAEFTLMPAQGGGTLVSWVSRGLAPYDMRLAGTLRGGMARHIGKQLEANLQRLKAAAETAPVAHLPSQTEAREVAT